MKNILQHKIRLGNKERELLEAISLGDYVYGVLTSAGSSRIFYRQMHAHAEQRLEREERRRIKKRLENLERKKLIRFETCKEGKRAMLTKQGVAQLDDYQVIIAMRRKKKQKWDGKWRIVSFDIPQEHDRYRRGIRNLLVLCGFEQIEQSVYVCPYFAQELYDYLQENQVLGGYVHFFEGNYIGNDIDLRKKFRLDV